MFIAVGDDEYKNPDPKDASHDLDFEAHVLFNQAVRVPNMTAGASRRRRRPRLGRLGPGVRRGREVHLPVPRPGAGDPDEGDADRHGPARSGPAASPSTPPGNVYQALAAGGLGRRPAVRRATRTSCSSRTRRPARGSGRASSARPGLERAYGVAIDPAGDIVVTGYTNGDLDGGHAAQHDGRRVRRQVRSRRQPGVAAPVRRSRASPTAATRSRRTRPGTSTSPATPAATSPRRTSATRTSTSPSSTRTARSSGCSSSGARARTRAGASPRPATVSASAA